MLYDIDGKKQDNVSFGNKAEISELRLPRRVQPIHYGVNYHKDPLQFKLVFGAEQYLDRYDLEAIALWLTGYQDYQWLSIAQQDLDNVQFRCLIRELTPISIAWLPIAFEATVLCDCPYAYSYPKAEQYTISGTTELLIRNEGSVREYVYPTIRYVPDSGVHSLSIVNDSDDHRLFQFTGLPDSVGVLVDNQNGIIQGVGTSASLYPCFNLNFFRFVPGDNHLVISGDGTLTFDWRTLHNVAG